MPFAAVLRKSLQDRGCNVLAELERGDSLEDVLNRHLRTVEQLGGGDAFTCILLLSPDGKRLSYGAAPTVPASYCRASESIEIGPRSGSCGAAAYLGRPVYSLDIATDPVWGDYASLALQHGYRSCWSTPIRNSEGAIIGTFAILHRTVGMPTHEEIEAIDLITESVADAIMRSREPKFLTGRNSKRPGKPPLLRLVSDNQGLLDRAEPMLDLAKELFSKAVHLDGYANRSESKEAARNLRDAAELSRKLAANIIAQVRHIRSGKRVR